MKVVLLAGGFGSRISEESQFKPKPCLLYTSTGVSCQCAALINFLRQQHIPVNNLLTANILCHGVPSQKMFNAYREEQERVLGKRLVSFLFRNKRVVKSQINSRAAYIEYDD